MCECRFMCVAAHMQRSDDNRQELVLSFHHGVWGLNASCEVCVASASTFYAILPA